jgi:hypothetical protein
MACLQEVPQDDSEVDPAMQVVNLIYIYIHCLTGYEILHASPLLTFIYRKYKFIVEDQSTDICTLHKIRKYDPV